ncbi:hypothetical protein INR49_002356 [Caranx melampygus]|nr:hypothetical protein INR49_002356 [Caranx melampygus]
MQMRLTFDLHPCETTYLNGISFSKAPDVLNMSVTQHPAARRVSLSPQNIRSKVELTVGTTRRTSACPSPPPARMGSRCRASGSVLT